MATTLADLLKPALRMAGITKLPGITPSTDQYGELIPHMNRMLGSFNCSPLNIFSTSIASYPLTASLKSYTIGAGGAINAARPMHISAANITHPGSLTVRSPVRIIDAAEWARISVQDTAGSPPQVLYYDHGFAAGLGKIYLIPQPAAGYSLELFTWDALSAAFTATSDAVVLPPGYEEAIVYNFAVRVAALYPLDSKLSPDVRRLANQTLAAIQSLNAQVPKMTVDYPSGPGLYFDWLIGGSR